MKVERIIEILKYLDQTFSGKIVITTERIIPREEFRSYDEKKKTITIFDRSIGRPIEQTKTEINQETSEDEIRKLVGSATFVTIKIRAP